MLLGQTVTANVKIDIEKATANIEVTAGGTLLQTEDANITANVSNREIANIPNPGGDITYSAILTPGITGNTSSGGGFGNFSAFGLPGTSNLFTVNGNDYNDPFLNLKSKRVIVAVPARLVELSRQERDSASVTLMAEDGTTSLTEIRFSGKKYELSIGQEAPSVESGSDGNQK